jgi:RNA-directed DNA polymerase
MAKGRSHCQRRRQGARGLTRLSASITTHRSLARKALHQPTPRFDHLDRRICQEAWIRTALDAVLSHTGARTAGMDGVTTRTLASEEARVACTWHLRAELREERVRPMPVRRVHIPKSAGKRRPLGLATRKDRVVQMLVKRVLEPIWESDFLHCSNGCRPRRRTMDGIALLDSSINARTQDYGVIAGDIQGAFDNIPQGMLWRLLAQRLADRRLLKLAARVLKAGVMEGPLFRRTELGTPQGAICSPLWAHVDLHQLDRYGWQPYGGRHRKVKERRRRAHLGNGALMRYADDWLRLTNGRKAEAQRRRDEVQRFLWDERRLERSVATTHVTHVNDGFDFLGLHLRRYVGPWHRPKRLIRPSRKAQDRVKATVKEMSARKRCRDTPRLKFGALNAVLRGWIGDDRHCHAKKIANDLDSWVNRRVFLWRQKRHRRPPRRVLARSKQRQDGRRYNWDLQNGEDGLCLSRMSDQPLTTYRSRQLANPSRTGDGVTELERPEVPVPPYVWLGNAENNEGWRELKAAIKAERGAQCERCGNRVGLDRHHVQARRYGGRDIKANAQLLCEPCHVQTSTYGDHGRLQ